MDNPFGWKTSDEWHWAKQPSGSISLPDFIEMKAKGEAKTHNGHVYLKKPGSDPEMQALMAKRKNDANKAMEESITKKLYAASSLDDNFGLAKLLKD